jgi:hypothetical protein
LRSQIEQEFSGSATELEKQKRKLKDDLEANKRKVARLVSAIEDGANVAETNERLRQRQREQAEIAMKLAEIDRGLTIGKVRISDEVMRLLADETGNLLREGGEEARMLVRSVIERAELVEGRVRIHYYTEAVMDTFILQPRAEGVTWSVPPSWSVPKHTPRTADIAVTRPRNSPVVCVAV